MTNERPNEFNPTVVFPPGDTLTEVLETLGMTQSELADRTGRTTKHLSEIVQGKAAISVETALQLERVLDVPSHIWLGLERKYREFLARKKEQHAIQEQAELYREWLGQFPVRQMADLGWIQPTSRLVDKARELLLFFRIASIDQWNEGEIVGYDCSLRASDKTKAANGALLAWLWRGRLEGMAAKCSPYSRAKFSEALKVVRNRVASFDVDTPALMQEQCADAGVALCYVHELPGMGAYGATSWIAQDKALIQMCLRGKREDQFWFTFFHEAGHILLHGKTDSFVEGDRTIDEGQKEQEANKFAADYLINPKEWHVFIRDPFWSQLNRLTYKLGERRIAKFARQENVSTGIVVGRLQREGIIHHRHYNNMKAALDWANS